MNTTTEEHTPQDTLRAVIFNEEVCDIHCTEVAWEAVWHFFIGGDSDFNNLYERRQVNTRAEAEAVYIFCSEYLLDNEFYVSELLDDGRTNTLTADILIPLSGKLKELMGV